MNRSNCSAPSWALRRPCLAALAVALGTLLAAAATPAHAADGSVGYVRLAHLSPDTPEVDVYLSKPGDTAFKEQVFDARRATA